MGKIGENASGSGHRLLMRALAARGNGSGVWRALMECRRVLEAEGLAPSSQTEALARELTGLG